MIPKKVNIAGIEHKIIEEDRTKLRLALKKIGIEDWKTRFSYWDPIDAHIYVDRSLRKELKEFFFCIEVVRAWSYFIGDKLAEDERIIRPYAVQLRLLLRSVANSSKGKSKNGKEDEKSARYIH